VISAKKILRARRMGSLDFTDLKKMNVVLKRAQYFITCKGKTTAGVSLNPEAILRGLLSERSWQLAGEPMEQISLFDDGKVLKEDMVKCLTGQI
jgi:predicted DNA-binding helix-hairpin-helix protein